MSQKERRHYVRINDRLLIHIVPGEPPADNPNAPFENQAYQFQYLDNQLNLSLIRVRAKNSDLAETLSLLNQKINIAFQTGLRRHNDDYYAYQDVSISACGISAACDLPLATGDKVWISMLLPPFNNPINTAGVVVLEEDGPLGSEKTVRIDYVDLDPEQEEALIQYVIRRQNEQLVAARKQKDSGH
jgi:hypothetical protein